MKCNEIFEKIDSLYESYLSVWEDVCNIESPTHYKAGVDAVGAYFSRLAEDRGWKVEVCEQEVAGNAVCITMNPDVDAAPLSLSGHIDTVHEVGLFGTPAVRFDGDKVYGPGVTDCKGGVVAAFLAMDALHECGYKARPVQLLLQSDEEVGSRLSNLATIEYICDKARDAVAFLNLEGYIPGTACLIRKGIVSLAFTVIGKEAHASKCATEGASAILEAAHKIIELEKIKDADGLTCSCGVIKGGTVPNTVPGKCEFTANIRFATKEQFEYILEHAKRVADTVYVKGCTCTVTQKSYRPAMELSEKNTALLDKMNAIFKENGLSPLEIRSSTGGSDAAYTTIHGIPTVDSIGVAGAKYHSKDEYAVAMSLCESAKRIAAVACCI